MDLAGQLAQLQQFSQAIHPLPADVMTAFLEIWQPFACRRKTLLTAAGDVERNLYFVTEGVQRAYYLADNDRDATIVFTYPVSFSGVADSFLTQKHSRYYFETLTGSEFLRTTWSQVSGLMDKHPEFERLIRKAASFTLESVLARQAELQCFSVEEKFRTLLKRSPHLLQLIPHKYLASYLGIDATTFSKLLGSIRL